MVRVEPRYLRLVTLFAGFVSVSGCGLEQANRAEEQAQVSGPEVKEFLVEEGKLALASVNMNATLFHEFDFSAKKILSLGVKSSSGLGVRVVTGMETDNICPRQGTFDPKGKVYKLVFGRFVDQNGRRIPFDTKAEIVQNLTASGVHAGQLAVNFVQGRYDQFGQAVVDLQFCARNVGRQSYVREFRVTLSPKL